MFRFGVDSYREQWPEERWPEDPRLTAEAGFNAVRLDELAWSFRDRHPGCFDFDWLDRRGMKFVTGTDEASELTDAQILTQLKMYIAAALTTDFFGCDLIGIQYQQGLKDMTRVYASASIAG